MYSSIDELKKLAGVNEFKGYSAYEGSNISITGTEKKQIEREKNIQPGTDEWFKLWFSKPYLTDATPFRGRTKK